MVFSDEEIAAWQTAKQSQLFMDMSERLRNSCGRARLTSPQILEDQTRNGLLRLRGWGPKQVDELERVMKKHNLYLSKDTCKACGQWL